MELARLSWTIASLLLAILVSFAAGDDSSSELCEIQLANLAVLGDTLYFMGGRYATIGGGDTIASTATNPDGSLNSSVSADGPHNLFWMSLDDNFPIGGAGIPASSLKYTEVPADYDSASNYETNLAWQMTNNSGGALFYTKDTIYTYGGYSPFFGSAAAVTSYNITTGSWGLDTVNNGEFNVGLRKYGAAVSLASSGLSYFIGGTDPDAPGLLTFNASNPAQLSWTNDTLGSGSFGIEPIDPEFADLHFLPYGDKGVLIARSRQTYDPMFLPDTTASDHDTAEFQATYFTYIYDIASSTWYRTNTSGIPPIGDFGACSVVTSAPDNSSYQITYLGGSSSVKPSVYTLSIPSFQWINVTDIDNPESNMTDSFYRVFPRYLPYRNSQMLILGGSVFNVSSNNYTTNNTCVPGISPTRVLDLTSFTRQDSLNSSLEYTVPQAIYEKIGGDANGKANQTSFDNFGDQSALIEIFSKQMIIQNSTASVSGGSSPGSPSSTSPKSASNDGEGSNSKRAIIGGVIGGVLVVLLIAGFAVWKWQRARKARNNAGVSYEPVTGKEGSEDGTSWQKAEFGADRPLNEMETNRWAPELGARERAEMNADVRPRELVGEHERQELEVQERPHELE